MAEELTWLAQGKTWLMEKGPGFLVDLAVFILLIVVGAVAIKIMRKALKMVLHKSKRINETLEKFLVNVTGKVLWVVLLMIALPRLGIDVAPLIAGLGVTGFIVGFAFQESLGNLAAGMMIVINQPFKIGDFVDAGGHQGTIGEINMMATSMITLDNKKIVLPNRGVWGNPIVNYSALEKRRVDLTVGIAYGSPIGKARDVIAAALTAVPGVLSEPAPRIELNAMADSSLNLVVRPWCKSEDYWNVFFAANQAIQEALDAAGIVIPFPQVDVHHHGAESIKG
ncbi:MAG TPA: mechanosensitive ion channel family protein [bacterium]|nr:mechanosensitive ion channel family protein [bacterium]